MKQKEYLLILGSALVIIVLWVIFNVYHNYTASTIDPSQSLTIVPIDGTFDQSAIDEIKNRKRVGTSTNAIQTPSLTPTPTITLSASPSPTLIASPSPSLSQTP